MGSKMFVFVILILINTIKSQFTWGPHKTVTLNTSQPSLNGASISTNPNSIISNNNQWILSPSNQIGYDMKISLNSSWSAKSYEATLFHIKLHRNESLTTANNLIVIFSFNDAVYLSNVISINNANDNFAYPGCPKPPDTDSQGDVRYSTNPAFGDIEEILSSNDSQSRISKATQGTYNNGNFSRWYSFKNRISWPNDSNSFTFTTGQTNIWPLHFLVASFPTDADGLIELETANHTQVCSFVMTVPNITHFDIYLAVGDTEPGKQIAITNIELESIYRATYSPTTEPTSEPTFEPTQPTIEITFNPTNDPVSTTITINTTEITDTTNDYDILIWSGIGFGAFLCIFIVLCIWKRCNNKTSSNIKGKLKSQPHSDTAKSEAHNNKTFESPVPAGLDNNEIDSKNNHGMTMQNHLYIQRF